MESHVYKETIHIEKNNFKTECTVIGAIFADSKSRLIAEAVDLKKNVGECSCTHLEVKRTGFC